MSTKRLAMVRFQIPAVLLGLVMPGFAQAKTLDEAIRSLVNQVLEIEPNGIFYVSPVRGPSAGAGIVQTSMINELERRQARIGTPDATVRIDCRVEPQDANDELGINIVMQLFDNTGRPLVQTNEFSEEALDSSGTAVALGMNSSFPADDTEAQRNARLSEAHGRSTSVIDGSVIKSSDGQFGIEITVLRGGQLVDEPPHFMNGRLAPFIDLEEGDVYAVKAYNYSQREVVVRLTIDGVNSFHFFEGDQRPSSLVIPAAANGRPGMSEIRGWKLNSSQTDEFKVERFELSVAAELGQSDQQCGVITAVFIETQTAEPRFIPRSLGTGRGNRVSDPSRTVQRGLGPMRAAISVEYTHVD